MIDGAKTPPGPAAGSEAFVRALSPWVVVVALAAFIIPALQQRSSEGLREQDRLRRERSKLERSARSAARAEERIRATLGPSLAPSSAAAPSLAELRRRGVDALRGLSFSAATLDVSGAPTTLTVASTGSFVSSIELLDRLGDPARGSFLRSFVLRDVGEGYSLTAGVGVFGAVSAASSSLALHSPKAPPTPTLIRNPFAFGLSPRDDDVSRPNPGSGGSRSTTPRRPIVPAPVSEGDALDSPPALPEPPFRVRAIVQRANGYQASIRLDDGTVRLVSPGASVEGWRCRAIDPDGATFEDPSGRTVVLPLRASR